jgi:hypothetical protein
MLLFSIDEIQVLGEVWKAHGDGDTSLAGKLDNPRRPMAFTQDEAARLAPAMDAWLGNLPKNIEGGVMLGQSELQIVRKLLAGTAA